MWRRQQPEMVGRKSEAGGNNGTHWLESNSNPCLCSSVSSWCCRFRLGRLDETVYMFRWSIFPGWSWFAPTLRITRWNMSNVLKFNRREIGAWSMKSRARWALVMSRVFFILGWIGCPLFGLHPPFSSLRQLMLKLYSSCKLLNDFLFVNCVIKYQMNYHIL